MMNKLKKKLSYRSSQKKNQERLFLENGSILLEELIADCDGKSIPIRSFSSSQILEITNNFHSSYLVAVNRSHNLYCGVIENKSYLIKRFLDYKITQDKVGQVYNDIVLSARMSNHNNFLKLYGCCLEFNLPVIVLENAEHGPLNQRGSIYVNGEETSLPWNVKLNIVKEIANAVTYLHTAFSRIIIHRVVTPTNIVLDSNFTPKFSDLSMSITLPEGKTRLKTDDVIGTLGYLDPIYRATSVVTEYTDVYSFGIFLMANLTGKPALVSTSTSCGGGGVPQNLHIYVKGLYENGKLDDLMIMKDITSGQKLQLEECVKLAMSCCEERDEDRPKMIHVAKELKRIQTSS